LLSHASRACWVGRISGYIFRRLWTKVHQIKRAYVEWSQFATPFSVRRQLVAFRRYSRTSCQVVRTWAQILVV